MPRVKTGFTRRRRHKKILEATKSYQGSRSTLFKRANEAYLRAGEHAFVGRKLRKRDTKTLWIVRLNAFLRNSGTNYSTFINNLRKSDIVLDRKILADLAVRYPETLTKLVEKVQKAS